MTPEDQDQFLAGICEAVKVFLAEQLAPLKRQIAELEARPELKYAGTYEAGRGYPAGTLVTRSGGLWLAETPTHLTPGAALDSGWKLIVKRGEA